MENTNRPVGNFKVIQIIYASLMLGVIAFLLFTITTIKEHTFNYADGTMFMYLVPLIFIVGIVLSTLLYKKTMASIVKGESIFKKITKYQIANIMRGAPLEAAGLVSVVAILMTSNYYYLLFVGLAIIAMLIHFPSKYRFENAVELSFEEKKDLENM